MSQVSLSVLALVPLLVYVFWALRNKRATIQRLVAQLDAERHTLEGFRERFERLDMRIAEMQVRLDEYRADLINWERSTAARRGITERLTDRELVRTQDESTSHPKALKIDTNDASTGRTRYERV